MFKMSEYTFVAGLLSVGLALACYALAALVSMGVGRRRVVTAAATGSGGGGDLDVGGGSRTGGGTLATNASLMAWLALALIGASMAFRAIATGHGPFANMYEFSIAFAGGILAVYLYFESRYGLRVLGMVAMSIALALLLYATTIPATIEPLVPALQNNLLLTVHVAVAIVAYGTFAVAFAAALLYLVQPAAGRPHLPRPEVLEDIAYRAIVIGFPFLTLVVVLGAVWAEVAWGSYWSWDPKETASLVTWLIFGAYLHARIVRGWRGRRAEWLVVAGFAATLFTYFGNLFFGGLHSYSGLATP